MPEANPMYAPDVKAAYARSRHAVFLAEAERDRRSATLRAARSLAPRVRTALRWINPTRVPRGGVTAEPSSAPAGA